MSTTYPNLLRHKQGKRWGVYYYRIHGSYTKQDSSGATHSLARAIGNAVRHVAMGELERGEYAQALVIDRHSARIFRSYRRQEGGTIVAKEFK